MTRGPLPRFDPYEELEVSRLASVEVIEAAYRSLVKLHHPDVAAPADHERIKRLNLAREWLVDPVRRRRYDAATSPAMSGTRKPQAPSTTRSSPRTPPAPSWATPAGSWATTGGETARPGPRPASPGPTPSSAGREAPTAGAERPRAEAGFGINAPAVRQFLADLHGLDAPRARQVWDGRAVAHAKGYTEARRRAVAASRQRAAEWGFAREAASVIASGELGESTLTTQVLDVVADVAGALTIRDLVSRADFELLLLPWTWRGERLPSPEPSPARSAVLAGVETAARIAAGPPRLSPVIQRPVDRDPGFIARVRHRGALARAGSLPLLYVVIAIAGLGGVLAGLGRPPAAAVVADESAAPARSQAVAGVRAPAVSPPGATPAPVPSRDPGELRALQRGAAQAIRALAAAAELGDVAAAQALLGETAPGLRASGLRAASFPEVAAGELEILRDAGGWAAVVGADRLVSTDGSTWTFDYADRPLARLAGGSERELFWVESDGRHGLRLRIASATVSRSGLAIRFAWRYAAGGATVDPYFDRAAIEIDGVTLGQRRMNLATEPVAIIEASDRGTTADVVGEVGMPSRIQVRVSVTPRVERGASGGSDERSIQTVFELAPA